MHFNTALPNYHLQHLFSGNTYPKSLVMFMNHHGGAGWSILRVSSYLSALVSWVTADVKQGAKAW